MMTMVMIGDWRLVMVVGLVVISDGSDASGDNGESKVYGSCGGSFT